MRQGERLRFCHPPFPVMVLHLVNKIKQEYRLVDGLQPRYKENQHLRCSVAKLTLMDAGLRYDM